MDNELYIITLNDIVEALIERGYNPYSQLKGYIVENSTRYITSHKNAREMIQGIDIEFIEEYLKDWEKYQNIKWKKEFIEKYL